MMQLDMLTWALGVHGVVLPLSLTGLYRYSDRSSLFAKALEGTDELLLRIRRRVATTIEDELGPVIQRAGGSPLLVDLSGYVERPVDPVSSDAFREAIQRFLHSDATALVDYVQVYRARNVWCSWARTLSWTVLGLSFWEVVCLVVLGLAGMIFRVPIPETIIACSFVPTALLIVTFFSCHAGLLHQYDVIHENKTRYPEL